MQTTAATETITFRLDLEADANNTGLVGFFPAIHRQIVSVFGQGRPDFDKWKSSGEWSFSDNRGGRYFLYDYDSPKRTFRGLQLWHIGGNAVARENFHRFRKWLETHLHFAWSGRDGALPENEKIGLPEA